MAAVPPETGVGSMTPNWTLLAALDEAMYRKMGANYELYVVPISSDWMKHFRIFFFCHFSVFGRVGYKEIHRVEQEM